MLKEASYYLRMAAGMAQLQLTAMPPDPAAAIRDQFEHREERFLQMARHVLENRRNLYRRIFDVAHCSYADLEAGVVKNGLRETLARLLAAGVYVTHDEFRGQTPIVRDGKQIEWSAGDWTNPWGRGLMEFTTSGSTGRPLVTRIGVKSLMYRLAHEAIDVTEHNVRARARVVVGAILPSSWPIRRQLLWHRLGMSTDRWFALCGQGSSAAYRGMTAFLVAQLKLLGAQARYPEYLPPNDFSIAAKCLAQFRAEGRPAYVRGAVSLATRIAAVARERGFDISGTLFSVSGEPLTQAKRELMESTGSLVYPLYLSTEIGDLGYSCPAMNSGNCVHLCEDSVMLIPFRKKNMEFDSVFATNLLLWNPRILINVETDDTAVIERVTCDCGFQRAGFTMQARDIVSYGKITSQGMTVQATDLIQLLESDLPARFGGAPGDYQLAEIEGAAQTEMRLRVSPRTGVCTVEPVREFFLERIGKLYGGRLSQNVWQFTDGFHVVIEEPETTFTGKAHAIRHLSKF